jgi:hypothetical protein
VAAGLLGLFWIEPTWVFTGAVALWVLSIVAVGFAAREEWVAVGAGLGALLVAGTGLSAANPAWFVTVAVIGLVSAVFGSVAFLPGFSVGGKHRVAGAGLAFCGAVGLGWLVSRGLMSPEAHYLVGSWPRWLDFDRHALAISLLALGVYGVTQATRWRVEAIEYCGWGSVLLGVVAEFGALEYTTAELYSTSIAAYAVGMGYVYARHHSERGVPVAFDATAVAVGLSVPLLWTLGGHGPDVFTHLAWSVGLSALAIVAGIVLRVRLYLYGGAIAIVVATGWRTIVYLAGIWWVVLGLIGVAAIVVALTWERQRALFSDVVQLTENWR